jgi:hypothetical protein
MSSKCDFVCLPDINMQWHFIISEQIWVSGQTFKWSFETSSNRPYLNLNCLSFNFLGTSIGVYEMIFCRRLNKGWKMKKKELLTICVGN